jgi:pimeloyl-ACP methyl ester carboxylesterase
MRISLGPLARLGRFNPLARLSPRRRLLVANVLAVVGAVAAVGVVFAVRAAVSRPAAVPAQDRPGTVLLVPGYGGGTAALSTLASALRATGRTVVVVSLPGDGTGDLNRQADALDSAVGKALHGRVPSVDVVGYSAGGVVARLWARDHDGTHKARRIVTLGSPHHGAQLAAAGTAVGGSGGCPTACQQLAPGSSLLAGLAAPVRTPPQWLSVWTDQDQTVKPPDSARLDGAVNVVVQSVCPDRPVSHSELPIDAFVTTAVKAALGAGPITVPAKAACLSS